MALTPKGAATRQRIVEGASAVVRELGVEAATLDDVRARTATSKSQLFHYFPGGREDLLLAVAGWEADRVLLDQEPHLSRLRSWPEWQRWRDAVVARYRRQGTSCPLGALVAGLGRSSPAARELTTQLLTTWQARLERGIVAMQEAGEIRADLDAERAAGALVAGIQGGVVILLSTGRITHLEWALDTALADLREPGRRAALPAEGFAGRAVGPGETRVAQKAAVPFGVPSPVGPS